MYVPYAAKLPPAKGGAKINLGLHRGFLKAASWQNGRLCHIFRNCKGVFKAVPLYLSLTQRFIGTCLI
jgi:hypothetical protein